MIFSRTFTYFTVESRILRIRNLANRLKCNSIMNRKDARHERKKRGTKRKPCTYNNVQWCHNWPTIVLRWCNLCGRWLVPGVKTFGFDSPPPPPPPTPPSPSLPLPSLPVLPSEFLSQQRALATRIRSLQNLIENSLLVQHWALYC
jgi:hypothetical protein